MSSITRTRLALGKLISLTGNDNDTYLKAIAEESGLPERDIVNLIATTCKPGSLMLDVGANIGYISVIMSDLAKRVVIHAFEPSPMTFKFLQKNMKDNNIKNVKLHNIGLSDKSATMPISYSADNSSGAFTSEGINLKDFDGFVTEDIKLRALDKEYQKLGINKCDFMKVDIEGHEPNFIRGAQKFIARFKPVTILEVNHWCLNVFNRVSLPDYIDQVYKNYPHVFAFHEGEYMDLSDSKTRFLFYYENTVNRKFSNLLCGFDKAKLIATLNAAFDNRYRDRVKTLEAEKAELAQEIVSLKSSRAHRLATNANRVVRR